MVVELDAFNPQGRAHTLDAVAALAGAGGGDDDVGLERDHLVCAELALQLYRDAEPRELVGEPVTDHAELAPVRSPPGAAHDAAGAVRGLVDADPVTAQRGGARRLEPGRPGANDDDVARLGSPPERLGDVLESGLGVDRAPGLTDRRADRHPPADTSLVAAYARPHVLLAPLERLVHELGIGDQRPDHREEVGNAGGEHVLGLGERQDATGHDRRDAPAGRDLRRRGQLVTVRLVHRADHLPEVVVAPHRDVDVVEHAFLLEPLAYRRRRGWVDAAVDRLVTGDPHADHEIWPDRVPDRSQHLASEAAAAFEVAAVLVGANVRHRRQERADEEAVPSVHFDAVEPGLLRPACRRREAVEQLVDLALGDRLGRGAADRRGDRRRGQAGEPSGSGTCGPPCHSCGKTLVS